MLHLMNDRAQRLYEDIVRSNGVDLSGFSLVIVQHFVPNTMPFFKALRNHVHISALIPKPASINSATLDQLQTSDPPFPVVHAKREQLTDETFIRENLLNAPLGTKYIFLDVGGYFSKSIALIQSMLGDSFAGIIEDTENGHQKYDAFLERYKQKGGILPAPVYSVARSPLKEPEDHLVGQSVLYSTERMLRDHNALLTNMSVLIIGYGKIGKSIANSLGARNVSVWVHDRDPVRAAQAFSHGFQVPDRAFALERADVIIGASGNKSLNEEDFTNLKDGAFVCSVTSADDEFDFGEIRKKLSHYDTGNKSEVFINSTKSFYLLNKGNAINFSHNNVLGSFIYLVACELTFCISKIASEPGSYRDDRITTLNTRTRQEIASKWLMEFNDVRK